LPENHRRILSIKPMEPHLSRLPAPTTALPRVHISLQRPVPLPCQSIARTVINSAPQAFDVAKSHAHFKDLDDRASEFMVRLSAKLRNISVIGFGHTGTANPDAGR
jgi:hypothetical protein